MSDREILIQKLEAIRKNDNSNCRGLTHTDIIIFCRTTIAIIKQDYLLQDEFNIDAIDNIVFYLKLISAYGISHRYRSHLANECLGYINGYLEAKKDEQKKKIGTTSHEDEDF